MRHVLLALALSITLASVVYAQTVTVRKHVRELEIPLLHVLDALGLQSERPNNPVFKLDGENLIIVVEGAGT